MRRGFPHILGEARIVVRLLKLERFVREPGDVPRPDSLIRPIGAENSAGVESMPSPFPGMDPYLERRDLWADFHNRLAAQIGAELNRLLPTRFYARTEYRYELDIFVHDENGHETRSGSADVGVVRSKPDQSAATAVLELPRRELSPAVEVSTESIPVRRAFVEIFETGKIHRLVTIIEIVSPSNKKPGRDRERFDEKLREILASEANLVVVDLSRAGDRVFPDDGLSGRIADLDPAPDYLIWSNRSWRRNPETIAYSLYPISIQDSLPCVGIPLTKDEDDVPLDFQYVFQRVYDDGPYRRGAVDYGEPPEPPH